MIGANGSSRELRVSGGATRPQDAALLVMVREVRGRFGAECAGYTRRSAGGAGDGQTAVSPMDSLRRQRLRLGRRTLRLVDHGKVAVTDTDTERSVRIWPRTRALTRAKAYVGHAV
jgi:hypothetical protein